MTDHGDLKEVAKQIRKHILRMVADVASGHVGSSLSAVELTVALYWRELRHRADDPDWPDRDRFCLSKGHASPLIYAVLAEQGYFPVEELKTFRRVNSRLQGHPASHKLPGVEISAGSLGQGLSQAVAMALAARLDNRPSRIYCMVGDGECQEGQIWEAAMYAGNRQLDNLCVIVDYNGYQLDYALADINDVYPIADKFEAFKFNTIEIDGHNYAQILDAFARARQNAGRPTCIIAHTHKGKGVREIEDTENAHAWYPRPEQLPALFAEIDGGIADSGHLRSGQRRVVAP